jgi:ABC-type dipeptide/oligopeptide/nickel transport system permease component
MERKAGSSSFLKKRSKRLLFSGDGTGGRFLRRLMQAGAVLLGVSLATFLVAHATGDPVNLLVSPSAPEHVRSQMRTTLGLDRPLIAQYLLFLRHAVLGDFGQSFIYRQSVGTLVLARLPATLLLAGSAFAIALSISIPLGVLAAARGGWAAAALQLFSMLGLAIPSFWLGLMLVLLVAVNLRLLPVDGYGGISHLVLPALTLSLQSIARLSRLVAAGMKGALQSDYVRTARAKGLLEGRVVWVHALRNVLVPVVTMAGLELGDLLSSAVVVEVVFAWPGIGRLAVTALGERDFPLLQGTVFIAGFGFVIINACADALCARIDPRIGA